ncbi:MAG: AAA family ATPase [Polyangiaceae bacterium]
MGRPWDTVARRLFGRAEDLRSAEEALSHARIVTITGTAGVGKTRLAKELLSRCAEPALFVDVTEAQGAEALCQALVDALGVGREGASTTSVARVGELLAARGRLLLVLDNFEHLVATAATSVAVWAEMAPRTTLILTSRERLHVEAEVALDLAPLATPPAGAAPEQALRFDAVQLFLARARAARGAVAESADDVEAVAEIVRRLDGLPLALELSAARADVLSPAQILGRLARPFELLSGPSSRAPSRAGTLRDAVGCSWELLDGDERRSLSECAVFRGGFTLEAAEEITTGGGRVIDRIQTLVRKSLLQSIRGAPSEPVRLRMFESVRAFVTEIAPPPRGAEERHTKYYLSLAEQAANRLGASNSPTDLLTLSAERENLLSVLDREERRAATNAGAEASIDVARALAVLGAGSFQIGSPERWSARLSSALCDLEASGAAPMWRARLHVLRARSSRRFGRFEEARADLRRAFSLAMAEDAAGIAAEALLGEALVEQACGRSGASLLDRARDLALGAELPVLATTIAGHAGWGRFLEDEGAAHAALDTIGAVLASARALGDRPAEALQRRRLAAVYANLGRIGASRSELTMTIDLARVTGECELEAEAHASLGMLAVEEGNRSAAVEACEAGERALSRQGALQERASLAILGAWIRRVFHDSDAAEAAARATLGEALTAADALAMRCLLASDLADRGEPMAAEAELATLSERELASPSAHIARAHITLSRALAAERADDHVSAAAERRALTTCVRDARARAAPPAQPSVRIAARLLLQRIAEAPPSQGSLVLAADAAWFHAPGTDPVVLGKRKALRQILLCLADERLAHPGAAVDLEALLRAGWPGARMSHDSGRNRVHVAVSTLRRMGLRRVIVSVEHGWLIDPAILVVRRPDATPPPRIR